MQHGVIFKAMIVDICKFEPNFSANYMSLDPEALYWWIAVE